MTKEELFNLLNEKDKKQVLLNILRHGNTVHFYLLDADNNISDAFDPFEGSYDNIQHLGEGEITTVNLQFAEAKKSDVIIGVKVCIGTLETSLFWNEKEKIQVCMGDSITVNARG